MKKVLILLMFVSLGLVGQTPKMEIVVGTAENIDGITVTSKNTTPSSHNYSIYGLNKSTTYNGIGVYGGHEGSGTGVHGYSKNGTGVSGFSQMGTFGSGVYGLAYGAGKSGVKGYSENGYGNGILGEAESGIGVKGYALNFFSTTGIGGHFSNAYSTGYALVTGTGKVKFEGPGVGVLGADKFLKSINTNGDAEWSDLTPYYISKDLGTGNTFWINNTNPASYGATIYAGSNSPNLLSGGIRGDAHNTSPNENTFAVRGNNYSNNNLGYGVIGTHSGYGAGVYGASANGAGIRGESTTNYGVHGVGGSIGVWGRSTSSQGVQGSSTSGIGVYGISSSGTGGYFESGSGYALVTTSGNVGIGTSTPIAPLDIKGFAYSSHFYYGANQDTYIRGGIAASRVLINDLAGMGSVGIGHANPNELLDINGRMRIRHNVNTSGIWMSNSTNSLNGADGAFYGMKNDTETGIYIGNAWRFWVNNAGNGYLNGNLIQTSDKRLKKDISLLNNSLSNIYKLNGYHYKWIEESRSKDLQTGLIAQEVQKIFPELVQTDEKGFLSVNYIGLVPHLIEAVKDLRDENSSLKLKNQALETKNQTLESRLDKIEAMLSTIQPNTENFNSKK